MNDKKVESDGPAGLWSVLREIPRGRAAGYGDVGKALSPPVSGLLVGRWLCRCPEGTPWWRVVGKDGTLLIAKRDLIAARHQEHRLRAEGVEFIDEKVDMARFGFEP